VADLLSVDLLLAKARVTARSLARNFGIENPRLAFAGFNPHAGRTGHAGLHEELRIIAPAIALLREEGIDAVGPFACGCHVPHPRARANMTWRCASIMIRR
jgi:4-hydroxythreonine-4-phosphate dehydrogenase